MTKVECLKRIYEVLGGIQINDKIFIISGSIHGIIE